MKISLTSLLFILSVIITSAQNTNPDYNETLAKSLGADDYGMKSYIFVILKSGQNKSTDKSFVDSCFAGHLKNIGRLAESKQLIVAGPFKKNDSDFRGLFILNVSTVEEANKLLETDPAIKADLLLPVLYPWYGSAALPIYLDSIDKVSKSKF